MMKYTLIVILYMSGPPGVGGPTTASVPGFESKEACLSAKLAYGQEFQSLKEESWNDGYVRALCVPTDVTPELLRP